MLHGTSPSPRTSSTGHGGSALATASACTCRPHALDASDADGVAAAATSLAPSATPARNQANTASPMLIHSRCSISSTSPFAANAPYSKHFIKHHRRARTTTLNRMHVGRLNRQSVTRLIKFWNATPFWNKSSSRRSYFSIQSHTSRFGELVAT